MATYTFTIVIEKEPDDPGYFAHSPDLPGCFGAGLTREQTIEDMKRAIALHVEALRAHGDSIPAPVERPGIAEVTMDIPA